MLLFHSIRTLAVNFCLKAVYAQFDLHIVECLVLRTSRQDGFVENYLTQQREHVFSNVAVLIFVFDIESREFGMDAVSYQEIISALEECSPNAKVFCLIHKMDLIQARLRVQLFEERAAHIRDASGSFKDTVGFFATSIWDQSLYKAWTQIIYYLIPNAATIESLLNQLAEVIDARELILYERTTCLMVTHVTRGLEAENPFTDRFERISSILKTHKHSMACAPLSLDPFTVSPTNIYAQEAHRHACRKRKLCRNADQDEPVHVLHHTTHRKHKPRRVDSAIGADLQRRAREHHARAA
jgi:hypothetical protein